MPPLSDYYRSRILLISAAVICFCIFWWTGRLLDIPEHPGYVASLMLQPSPLVSVLAIAMVFWACAAIGTAVAGTVRYDAGLFVAGAALSALAFRGGPRIYTHMYGVEWLGSMQQLAGRLFLELLVLSAAVALTWVALFWLYRWQVIRDRFTAATEQPPEASWTHLLGALAIQVAVAAVAIAMIAQSPERQQVLAAVFIGAFLGPLASQSVLPTATRSLHWLAPLLVGLLAYLLVAWNPGSPLAVLARPLPLDYASAGPAGAILGYWSAQQWKAAESEETSHVAEARR